MTGMNGAKIDSKDKLSTIEKILSILERAIRIFERISALLIIMTILLFSGIQYKIPGSQGALKLIIDAIVPITSKQCTDLVGNWEKDDPAHKIQFQIAREADCRFVATVNVTGYKHEINFTMSGNEGSGYQYRYYENEKCWGIDSINVKAFNADTIEMKGDLAACGNENLSGLPRDTQYGLPMEQANYSRMRN